LICASVALADAGIEMQDLIAACTLVSYLTSPLINDIPEVIFGNMKQ
jgi:ribonuclease PH